jgi:hypothetical protein
MWVENTVPRPTQTRFHLITPSVDREDAKTVNHPTETCFLQPY